MINLIYNMKDIDLFLYLYFYLFFYLYFYAKLINYRFKKKHALLNCMYICSIWLRYSFVKIKKGGTVKELSGMLFVYRTHPRGKGNNFFRYQTEHKVNLANACAKLQ